MIAYSLENRIKYRGRTYKVNLSFDVILRICDMQEDPLFKGTSHFTNTAIRTLIGWRARFLREKDRIELFNAIFKELVFQGKKPPKDKSDKNILSFAQDAPYIYASFLQAYGIDLQKQRGMLDWRVFIALFKSLPEDTKIRYVMSVRGRDIPEPTKHNAKQIEALLKEKAFYALEVSDQEAEENFQQGVNQFAATLYKMARSGKA